MESAWEDSSVQTHARGFFELPVGTQTQVRGAVFRIAKAVFFMVPPLAIPTDATGAGARRREPELRHGLSVWEGEFR